MRDRVPVADVTLASEGEVADRPRWVELAPRPATRAILLVHGYNTKEKNAAREFDRFKKRLAALFPPIVEEVITSSWAGRRRIGALGYVQTVPYAVATSETLLQAIDQLCRDREVPEVVLVAHSLGCRVVMEALAKMAARPEGRPSGLERLVVILMAAAVPVYMLEPGGRLSGALRIPDQIAFLHSEFDFVLNDLFPLGQTLAFEGWFPAAVGLRGEPDDTRCGRIDMQPLNHSDYWDDAGVARRLCGALGVAMLGSGLDSPIPLRPYLPMRTASVRPPLGEPGK